MCTFCSTRINHGPSVAFQTGHVATGDRGTAPILVLQLPQAFASRSLHVMLSSLLLSLVVYLLSLCSHFCVIMRICSFNLLVCPPYPVVLV